MDKAQELAGKLLDVLIEKEKLENQLTAINKEITVQSEQLSTAMTDEGVDSIEIRGVKFSPTVDRAFVFAEGYEGSQWDGPIFFDWLREIKAQGMIKTKESVHYQTRMAFLRDWVDGKNQLPDFIAERFFQTVKYKKTEVAKLASAM